MRFGLLDRYILKIAAGAAVILLVGLTSVIWVTQALREVDLITGKGQTLVIFFTVTLLSLPALIAGIAPVALFMATLYTLNKLNSDSELIVMNAAGVPPRRLTRPFIVLTLITSALVGWMSLGVMPAGFRALRDLITLIRADFVANVIKEGQFVSLDSGVTFHYREKQGQALLGIFMQDRRDPNQPAVYIAERGQSAEADGNSFLMLEKGTIQRESRNQNSSSIISFERYALNLSALTGDSDGPAGGSGDGDKVIYKPRERTTWALLMQNPNEPYYKIQEGRFRAELHNRLSAPLYPIAFMLVAFAILGEARTTRQGRAAAIQIAILLVGAIRIGAYAAWTASVRSPLAAALLYILPIGTILLSAFAIGFGSRTRVLIDQLTEPLIAPFIALAARFRRA
ncbi:MULTISPECIES: LPS export ABC transporter permease LptF [unclassified Bosea (in: a-proteobacteria)]|uniref:LPS export ABC transporter permease LptF n=1 Tax=unclassified Bosea (in: a-proteobacteria) TaxID=2653178 RepID=UPI000F75FB6D|nr:MULTISPECIES: LPS export ABC transporter permease LptF [unclassified Bosea (in: a-proteobacteria)]AZO77384.1 LPS export ABC transporter permease LptF [Bosea sp. Tri-49]RXT22243.1 LPS export ABC transporter permease LptF [Bosea sp. Tri-39]RXT32585.1 LPS export ABC transporter permease LptF [Bosea sp. Tri-54]